MFTASPLLALPGEIRNAIFELAFAQEAASGSPQLAISPLALSLTCRQLLYETRPLAFAATTFSVRCQHPSELSLKFNDLPPILRPSIKKLQITIDITDFVRQWNSLRGILFAGAGLTRLEELSFQYFGEPKDERTEHLAIATLLSVLWRTITKCGNEKLKKIRVIHGSSMRLVTYYQFCAGMQQLSRESKSSWNIEKDDTQGRFHLVQGDGNSEAGPKIVTVLLGYTVREAELYRQVRGRLLKGSILETMQARRSAGNVSPGDIIKEAFLSEVQQLSRAFRLPYKIEAEAIFQAILLPYSAKDSIKSI